MATVKELITRFGFDIDDAGLKKLEDGLSAAKDGLLGLGIVGAGAAATLFGFVKAAADSKEELYQMSQRLGIGVEALRQLGFMGKLSGQSLEELGLSLQSLNRNIDQAKTGNHDLQKAFRQVGISGDALRSGAVNAGNALKVLSEKFAVLPDGPKKVALAMELFGRSGARMIPLLNRMKHGLTPLQAEVLSMGETTTEAAKKGEEFNNAYTVMEVALASIGKTIGTQLMPAAQEIVEQITRWIVQNKVLIKTNLTGFVNGLTSALKLTVRFADILFQSLSGLAHCIGGVEFATKALLTVMAVLSEASVLIGIVKIMQAVVALGNSFAMANLEVAAIPLAIGAVVVGLLLIMEDIYSFFTGKDSFLGDLLRILPEVGVAFKSVIEPIFEPFVALITMLTDGFGSWGDIFLKLGEIFVNVLLTPFRAYFSILGGIVSLIERITGSKLGLGKTLGEISSSITAQGIGSAFSGTSGITPQTAVAGAPGARNQTVSLGGVKQEFNFPAGTDPTQVGPKIADHAQDGLEAVLRQASIATSNVGGF